MQDLATAFIKVLGNEKASKEVFNISGDKYVSFDGLAKACAKVKHILLPNQISSSLPHLIHFYNRRVASLTLNSSITILKNLILVKRRPFHSVIR